MNLLDKTAIITGGASGMGLATAEVFLREGARVVIADVDDRRAREEAARLESLWGGGRVASVRTDVSDFDQVIDAVAFAVDTFGRLDVMFNNAGIAAGRPLLQHAPATDYRPIISIDQDGVYYGILAAARQFVAQGTPGVIVNTSSIYGEQAGSISFTYGAAKAAVIAFTRGAALELAPHGIRCVAITPGRVATPILTQFGQEFQDRMGEEQLRGMMTQPHEVAEVVAFLSSEKANAINGTVVRVDDGWSVFKQRLPADFDGMRAGSRG